MRVFALRNSKNEYVSKKNGEVTASLFDAALFRHEDMEHYVRYTNSGYKLVVFHITEVIK